MGANASVLRWLQLFFGWAGALEIALIACVASLVLLSVLRIGRVRVGGPLPERVEFRLRSVELASALDPRRRHRLTLELARCALGMGTLLPTIARVAPLCCGVHVVVGMIGYGCGCNQSCDGVAYRMMQQISEAMRHLALGVVVSLLAAASDVTLVAAARRAVIRRIAQDPREDTARIESGDEGGWSWAYWPRLATLSVLPILAMFAVVTANFNQTSGVRVSMGTCAPNALRLHVTRDGVLERDGVRFESGALHRRDPHMPDIVLGFDDDTTLEKGLLALDRLGDLGRRGVCVDPGVLP